MTETPPTLPAGYPLLALLPGHESPVLSIQRRYTQHRRATQLLFPEHAEQALGRRNAQGLGKHVRSGAVQGTWFGPHIGMWWKEGQGHSLALLVQQVEEASGLLADEVDTAHIVGVVDVVP